MILRSLLLGLAGGICMVGASTAHAATVSFSSNPIPSLPGSGVEIASQPASGSFNLTPGVHATESVWLYFIFVNNNATFSNLSFPLALTLNGVTESVPFLASQATSFSGTYTFDPNGTVQFNLPGIGVVDVTGLAVTTSIGDPLHAGPTQADFFLEPAATPLPAALPLFATGIGALGLLGWRRKRKSAAA